jgi:hypothetical protein
MGHQMESPYSRVVTAHASMAIEKSLVLASAPTILMTHCYFAPGTDLQPVQCLTRYAIVFLTPRKTGRSWHGKLFFFNALPTTPISPSTSYLSYKSFEDDGLARLTPFLF